MWFLYLAIATLLMGLGAYGILPFLPMEIDVDSAVAVTILSFGVMSITSLAFIVVNKQRLSQPRKWSRDYLAAAAGTMLWAVCLCGMAGARGIYPRIASVMGMSLVLGGTLGFACSLSGHRYVARSCASVWVSAIGYFLSAMALPTNWNAAKGGLFGLWIAVSVVLISENVRQFVHSDPKRNGV